MNKLAVLLSLSLMLLSPMAIAKKTKGTLKGDISKIEGVHGTMNGKKIKFEKCEVDYKIVSRFGKFKKVKIKKIKLIDNENKHLTFNVKTSRKNRKAKHVKSEGNIATFENRIFKIKGDIPANIDGLDELLTQGLNVDVDIAKNEVKSIDLNMSKAGFRIACAKPEPSEEKGTGLLFGEEENHRGVSNQ